MKRKSSLLLFIAFACLVVVALFSFLRGIVTWTALKSQFHSHGSSLIGLEQASTGRQSSSVSAGTIASVPNPRRKARAEVIGAVAAIFNSPIEFYGKVIDQYGAPVNGARVDYSAVDKLWEQGSEYHGQSDKNGNVLIASNHEAGLSVGVNKDGFDGIMDLGYRLFVENAGNRPRKVINYYNINDYALFSGVYPVLGNISWEQHQQDYKPNSFTAITYAYDKGPPDEGYPKGQRCCLRNIFTQTQRPVLETHESMSYIARPRSKALGAKPNSSSICANSVDFKRRRWL